MVETVSNWARSDGALAIGLTLAFAVGGTAGVIVRLWRPRFESRRSHGGRRRRRLALGALFAFLAADGVALMLVGRAWLAGLYGALAIVMAIAWLRSGRDHASMRVAPRPTSASSAPDTLAVEATAPAAATEPSRPRPAAERRALGYVCVGRDALARDLPAHSAVIKEWIAANPMRLVEIVHDVERDSGKRGLGPALHWALERIAAGDADVLVTARLEHLSPTVAELSPILSWFNSQQRTLVAIDFRLDTATEAGQLVASALAGVGGWERARLSARTRRGLEAARARGSGNGRAAVADIPGLRERIARMRKQGMTLQAIADALNDEGVATLRGGAEWRPSSVQRATGYRRPASPRPDVELPGATPAGEADAAEAPTPRS
jgi:DNA invertase Pin-like site-specific DNA recombinase